MKYYIIIAIIGTSTLLSGCEFKYATQENNIMGNLTTTVFDDRNSFEDVELNQVIKDEVFVKPDRELENNKDDAFWTHIINQVKNMRWK